MRKLTRSTVACVVVTGAVWVPSLVDVAPAGASSQTCYTVQYSGNTTAEEVCADSQPAGLALSIPGHKTIIWGPPPDPKDTWRGLDIGSNAGMPCQYSVTIVGPGIAAQYEANTVSGLFQARARTLPHCPPRVSTPSRPSIPYDFAQSRSLGIPSPKIRAVTNVVGLPTCLEVQTPTTFPTVDVVTPWGRLVIDGSAGLLVDWGDGSKIESFDTTGDAYPTCDVRHLYATNGKFTINATYAWHLVYSYDGSLPALTMNVSQTVGTLANVRVVDVQAVVS